MNMLFVLLILVNDSTIGDCEQYQLNLTNCDIENNYTYALNNNCEFIVEKYNDKTMELTTDIEVCDFNINQDGTAKFYLAEQELYKNKANGNYYIRYDAQLDNN